MNGELEQPRRAFADTAKKFTVADTRENADITGNRLNGLRKIAARGPRIEFLGPFGLDKGNTSALQYYRPGKPQNKIKGRGKMPKEDKFNCSNKSNHVSAWPAFDRKLCPNCGQVYVRKEGGSK